MRRLLRTLGVVAAVAAIHTGHATAQTSHSHLGVHVLYNTTFNEAGAGIQFSAPIGHHLEFYPSADFYFQNPGTRWQANADLKYRAFGEKTDWLYVGTGLNLSFFRVNGVSATTRAGWNVLMGAESIKGRIHPFGEMRATITDHTRFQVQGGVNITLGKNGHR